MILDLGDRRIEVFARNRAGVASCPRQGRGGRDVVWRVDPDLLGQAGDGGLPGEALGVSQVGGVQGLLSGFQGGLGVAVVDLEGRQQGDAVMVMVVLYNRKKRAQKVLASS